MATDNSKRASRDPGAISTQASLWLVRRDRGLTPQEQDEYMQWLTADSQHARSLAQHAAAFERLMQLYEWQPGQSAKANPDLFAPRHALGWLRWAIPLAAAALIAIGIGVGARGVLSPRPEAVQTFLRVNERQALPDGTLVELKDGSQIELAFSANERRVRLSGEAHFNVTKSPVPFIVHAGAVMVRAVGTEFNVRADAEAVDVLVTEGKVAVQYVAEGAAPPDPAAGPDKDPVLAGAAVAGPDADGSLILAGQRAIVRIAGRADVEVHPVTAEETQVALAWKAPRLQFYDTPLSVAIDEFNRRNRVRIVLESRELGAVPIGGAFRIDNVDNFVRLLEATLDVRAVRHGDDKIVLKRKRPE
jgi:transmembrane sensor